MYNVHVKGERVWEHAPQEKFKKMYFPVLLLEKGLEINVNLFCFICTVHAY